MDNHNSVLTPSDASELVQSGLLSEARGGMRSIHRRRAYNLSDTEYQDVPLVSGAGAATWGHSQAFVNVPDQRISKATLTYVGFTEDKAEELWQRWTSWPAGGPRREGDEASGELTVTFADFMTKHMGSAGDSSSNNTWGDDDDEWARCLADYGLTESTIASILHPAFSSIRRTETCAFWARDTIEMRYAGISEIQKASRERAENGPKSKPQQQQQQASATPSAPSSSPLKPASFAATTAPQSSSSSPRSQTPTRTAVALAARSAPGHTFLYRAADAARTATLFHNGVVAHIETLVSSAPSDFSGNQSLYYFTPQFRVAEVYAAYAKHRSACEAIVIVAIMVPNSAIEALRPPAIERLFWPNPDWASVVWHSRRNATLPKNLRKYRQALLVIGHIATHPSATYWSRESPANIREDDILREDGSGGTTKGIQYVFSDSDEGREWLLENGGQAAQVFPYTAGDMEAVIREAAVRAQS